MRRLIALLFCLLSWVSFVRAADKPSAVSEITGQVLNAAGEPAAGATVRATFAYKQIDETTTAAGDGNFSLSLPVEPKFARSVRFDTFSADGDELSFDMFDYNPTPPSQLPSLAIELAKAKSGMVKVVDAQGDPIKDARVAVQFSYRISLDDFQTNDKGLVAFRYPETERVMAVVAWKDNAGLDYHLYQLPRNRIADASAKAPEFPDEETETLSLDGAKPLAVEVVNEAGEPVPETDVYPWLLRKSDRDDDLNLAFFSALRGQTNQDGEINFGWFPSWQTTTTTIWPHAVGYSSERRAYDPTSHDGKLKIELVKQVSVSGMIADADGNPVSGIAVSATGAGYGPDRGRGQTTTDTQGRYQLYLSPENIYLLFAGNDEWASNAVRSFVVRDGEPIENKDLTVRKPTRVFGVLTNETTGDPVSGKRVIVYQYGDDLNSLEKVALANPTKSRSWICPMRQVYAKTDELIVRSVRA